MYITSHELTRCRTENLRRLAAYLGLIDLQDSDLPFWVGLALAISPHRPTRV
jgi:hypothetical protein